MILVGTLVVINDDFLEMYIFKKTQLKSCKNVNCKSYSCGAMLIEPFCLRIIFHVKPLALFKSRLVSF